MSITPYFPDNHTPNWFPGNSSTTFNAGDLVYDNGSGTVLPAGSQATQGSEAADQALFAANFAGVIESGVSSVSLQASNIAATFPLVVNQDPEAVWNCTCPSQTFNHGDLVGVYSNYGAGGTSIPITQEVDACGGDPARAIGKVFGYYGTATTQVAVMFFAKKYNSPLPAANVLFNSAVSGDQTFSLGSQTITLSMPSVVRGTPTAAANYALPVEAQSAGKVFLIENAGTGAGSITLTAAQTIEGNATIPVTKNALVFCDGKNWGTIVSA
jgi:hypothetical protein